MSDPAVASALGVSCYTVMKARATRGIPTFRLERYSPEQLAQLGKASDERLAEEWGVSSDAVTAQRKRRGIQAFQTQKPWTPEEVNLLGTMSDAEVARRVGRSLDAVRAARYSRGIRTGAAQRNPHLDDIKLDYTTTRTPVPEIAARYGVPTKYVSNRAHKRRWTRPESSIGPQSNS